MPRWICWSPASAPRAAPPCVRSMRPCRGVMPAPSPPSSRAMPIGAARYPTCPEPTGQQPFGSLLRMRRMSWHGWRSSKQQRRGRCGKRRCNRCRLLRRRHAALCGSATGGNGWSLASSNIGMSRALDPRRPQVHARGHDPLPASASGPDPVFGPDVRNTAIALRITRESAVANSNQFPRSSSPKPSKNGATSSEH